MIEDVVYRSFYAKTGQPVLKETQRRVEGVSLSNKTNNNLKNREPYKEYTKYQKNKSNNNSDNNPFIIQDICEISNEGKALYELSKIK